MSTRLLMTAAAAVLGITGVALTFLPDDLARALPRIGLAPSDPLALQLLGALYFAFAMVDWTAREHLIGGIYSRPVAIGNLAHFTIGALALARAVADSPSLGLLVPTLVYGLFAVAFGVVFFRHPAGDGPPLGRPGD